MPFSSDGSWRPNLKQERFLAVPTTVREAAYLGGAGSGKSEILLMYGIAHGWYKNPGFKQVFMRRTFPELRNEIVPRSRKIYPKFGARFNKTDMIWTFESGAMIFLGHCENEADVSQYDSMEINLFTPDEITSFTEYIYTYIGFTRVRTSYKELPAIVRTAGMPGGVGHTWVQKRFIEPFPSGGKIIRGKGGNKRTYVFATLADNEQHIDPEYSRALDALPEAERQAKKFGDWGAFEGQVFDEFRDKHFAEEPLNAIHVVPPFDIPSWWPRICAIDWGFAAMCSIGWAAISPSKRVYVYRHQMFKRMKIEEWVPQVKFFIDKEKPADIVICHSANQQRGDPHSILEQVNDAIGTSIRLGEKNRVAGKALLHEYLRWKVKEIPVSEKDVYDAELATWLLRNKGNEEYQRYMTSFVPRAEEINIPRLQFFDLAETKVICDAIKACVYERSDRTGKKKEDVAEFDGDDPYDMLRMLLHAADAFFMEAELEQQKLSAIDGVVSQFKASGDMTAYYRNMRRIETTNHMPKAISRYHHARYN